MTLGLIDDNDITAFVGQNESGKSNLFEALYRLNPIITEDTYNVEEDWPGDNWPGKRDASGKTVCSAKFTLDQTEIEDLYAFANKKPEPTQPDAMDTAIDMPASVTLQVTRAYGDVTKVAVSEPSLNDLDPALVSQWSNNKIPKFVYVTDYGLSGTHTELDQLRQRWDDVGRKTGTN